MTRLRLRPGANSPTFLPFRASLPVRRRPMSDLIICGVSVDVLRDELARVQSRLPCLFLPVEALVRRPRAPARGHHQICCTRNN